MIHVAAPVRPRLLTIGAAATTLFPALWTMLFLLLPVAGTGHSVDGRSVGAGVFFFRVGLPLALLGVAGLLLARGLWRHQPWARPLAVALCFLAPVLPASLDASSRRGLPSAVAYGCGWAALTAACLYGLPTVRQYYASLSGRREAPMASGPTER